jgi:hypothetical protein
VANVPEVGLVLPADEDIAEEGDEYVWLITEV